MAAPLPGMLPGRCAFFVEKKKRFCKMIVGKGKTFCGEHATMVYYVENINAGSADGDETLQQVTPPLLQVCLCERSRTQLQSLVDKLKTAATGELRGRSPGGAGAAGKGAELCGVRSRSRETVSLDPRGPEDLRAPEHLRRLAAAAGGALQHSLQVRGGVSSTAAALVVQQIHNITKMADEEPPDILTTYQKLLFIFPSERRSRVFRGICEGLVTIATYLKEETSTMIRMGVDGKHQDAGVEFERLQVDIQHLDLSKVPQIKHKKLPLVGVGKHLCGAATDLALRCLLETPEPRETEPPPKRLKPSEEHPGLDPSPVQGPGLVQGVAVALCCHHRCEWRHYVGQQFFLQRGLGAAEFSAFCRMSSWATCGLRPTNQDRPPGDPTNQRGDDEEHEPTEETDAVNGFLSADERQQVGRLCKLLIDCGRLHFLQNKGFNGKLTRYISSDITLENVLLTAVPASASTSTSTSVSS
eukprot:superscaffoldBa00003539_g17169